MSTDRPDTCEFDRSSLLLRLDITFAAEVSAIGPLVARILRLAKETNCASGKEFEIESALYEALTNAVIHGCKGDRNKSVQVTASCDQSKGILLVVRDPGEGFDIESIPSPIEGERVFSSHGRGIFLINQLMDRVCYQRGGTEIRMLKR